MCVCVCVCVIHLNDKKKTVGFFIPQYLSILISMNTVSVFVVYTLAEIAYVGNIGGRSVQVLFVGALFLVGVN